ncbi:hypothetical protein [Ornithinimicrobium tianjinense]|uniref:Uncharacterized protein n=1 Tax=Ornithinimicrobium tianjinense TaxID=1195761 RepID=A0A917BF14_9MICO|nr:hypothetical protein [Ornithinimicrobium tianjinense]GGF39751.1 hypothetical protein GCM10011366_04210 [Ornithinimicrobium tianjinense]
MDVARLAHRGTELCRALADGHDVVGQVLELLADSVGTDMVSWSGIRRDGGCPTLQQHGRAPLDDAGVVEWERLLPTHPYATHLLTDPAPRTRLTDVVEMRAFERTRSTRCAWHPRATATSPAAGTPSDGTSAPTWSRWSS